MRLAADDDDHLLRGRGLAADVIAMPASKAQGREVSCVSAQDRKIRGGSTRRRSGVRSFVSPRRPSLSHHGPGQPTVFDHCAPRHLVPPSVRRLTWNMKLVVGLDVATVIIVGDVVQRDMMKQSSI